MPVFNVFFRDCMCEYLMSMKVKLCFKCVFFFLFWLWCVWLLRNCGKGRENLEFEKKLRVFFCCCEIDSYTIIVIIFAESEWMFI